MAKQMTFTIPSTQVMHQIAYLTLFGWSVLEDEWTKAGFLTCGAYGAKRHSLDDAYWAQVEANDKPKGKL